MDGYRCGTGGRTDGLPSTRNRWEKGSFAVNAKPPDERAPYRQRETAGKTNPLPSTEYRWENESPTVNGVPLGERALCRQPIKGALRNRA